MTEIKDDLITVNYEEFNDKYNNRDGAARKKMKAYYGLHDLELDLAVKYEGLIQGFSRTNVCLEMIKDTEQFVITESLIQSLFAENRGSPVPSEANISQQNYNALLQRYKDLSKEKGSSAAGGSADIPYDIKNYITEINTGLIDTNNVET